MWSSFEEWQRQVPPELVTDTLWTVEAYRLALFVADVGWYDVTKLAEDERTKTVANQLYRSLGSICANLAEGYSRGTGKDRARFYEYSLGSARESRDWYYKSRFVLGATVVQHRIQIITMIIRLLLTMVQQQRGRNLKEKSLDYKAPIDNEQLLDLKFTKNVTREIDDLLKRIPFDYHHP